MKSKTREDQITVKMSRVSHEWLVRYKEQNGASVRFTIDRAIALLKKQIKEGGKNENKVSNQKGSHNHTIHGR